MLYTTFYESPIGTLTIVADTWRVHGIWMEGQKYYLGRLKTLPEVNPSLDSFQWIRCWLDDYFAGKQPAVPMDRICLGGSDFQNCIWTLLSEIPRGTTVTYGQLARQASERLGIPRMSAQAVGGAVGHNPLSVLIPCHRVVGADGSLTGYAGGVERKRFLLELEGTDLSGLTVPKKGSAL